MTIKEALKQTIRCSQCNKRVWDDTVVTCQECRTSLCIDCAAELCERCERSGDEIWETDRYQWEHRHD